MSIEPQSSVSQGKSEEGANGRQRRRLVLYASLSLAIAMVVVFTIRRSPPAQGTVRENPKDGQRYVWITSGGYQQGCSKFDAECSPDEHPLHDVTISSGFWIGQTEVTVGAYRKFTTATGRRMPPDPTFGDRSLNPGWAESRMPVVNVDWNEALAFCQWIGGQLPTEAQWEFAARGGSAAARFGDLASVAWTAENSGASSLDSTAVLKQDSAGYLGRLSLNHAAFHPVGQMGPNAFGLYDMLGNVWEWTADWYGANYYRGFLKFDPEGQPNGDSKVLRGGSWTNVPGTVRVSVRGRRPPDSRSVDTGFRCVW